MGLPRLPAKLPAHTLCVSGAGRLVCYCIAIASCMVDLEQRCI